MEGQATEDKLSVLTTIFGNDFTQSVITNTLHENNNQFDPTVEKLLMMPANKVPQAPQPQPPQPAQPTDSNSMENIHKLHTMFGDLTQSVIATVYESNQRDVEGTVDTLLNMTSNEVATGVKREAEVAHQEQELRAYDEFKYLQQRLQEQERKATETAQQRAREGEQKKVVEEAQRKALEEAQRKAAEEAQRKALEEAQRKAAEEAQRRGLEEAQRKEQDEHARALREQERMLLEFQRRKVTEEQERERKRAEQEEMERNNAAASELERARREKEMKERAQALADAQRLQEELHKQTQLAEQERKILEARLKEEQQREEEERKRFAENERRLREDQENVKRSWEEKMRKLESEKRMEEELRRQEEMKRVEAKRAEEEQRARHEADMKKIVELERLKLEEHRKRVEEEKRDAEERLKALELATKKREEEEEYRRREEEEKKREEEERKREEEERERLREEMAKAAAQEQFAASAILVAPSENEPKVQISAEVDGTEIRGTWKLLAGELPSPHAWLGLFPKRAINTYAGFNYVTGTSGDFHFKGLTPGHYEVRLFGNKPVTSRLAESDVMLVGPKVLSFSAQIQGDHIMFEYKLDPPSVPTAWDWVGIYSKSERRNKNYFSSTYGNTSGTISASLPRTPGEYQARLFAAGAKYNEQATMEFEVVDNDHVSASLIDGVIKANWVLRTVEPTSSDWIGLYPAGENSAKYLASVYTHGVSAGAVDIPLPKDILPGTYELRLFSTKVGKYTTFKVSNVINV